MLWDIPPLDTFRVLGEMYHVPPAEFKQTLAELIALLAMEDLLTRPVRNLSLGERMKCELVAGLLHRPRVMFLDEPTLGLDVNAQARVRSFLADYNRRHGATLLLTSHYMADITALCPRVLLIHEGSLFHDGSLAGLTERFAPCRQVRLELCDVPSPQAFTAYGELQAQEGKEVWLRIPRERLTDSVTRLLRDFAVCDLEVSDPPIEELIGNLFRQAGEAR
jgi:ABC-2 type transport system ATP-binding protein